MEENGPLQVLRLTAQQLTLINAWRLHQLQVLSLEKTQCNCTGHWNNLWIFFIYLFILFCIFDFCCLPLCAPFTLLICFTTTPFTHTNPHTQSGLMGNSSVLICWVNLFNRFIRKSNYSN